MALSHPLGSLSFVGPASLRCGTLSNHKTPAARTAADSNVAVHFRPANPPRLHRSTDSMRHPERATRSRFVTRSERPIEYIGRICFVSQVILTARNKFLCCTGRWPFVFGARAECLSALFARVSVYFPSHVSCLLPVTRCRALCGCSSSCRVYFLPTARSSARSKGSRSGEPALLARYVRCILSVQSMSPQSTAELLVIAELSISLAPLAERGLKPVSSHQDTARRHNNEAARSLIH